MPVRASVRLAAYGPLLAATVVASAAVREADGRQLIAARLPRIVHAGGPFLRRPEITTVTFAADDRAVVRRLEAFGGHIARTRWWRQLTSGYCLSSGMGDDCIGPAGPARSVRLDRRLTSRVRDVDVEAILRAEVKGGALSGLGASALVVVYLPAGVALADAFHPAYCGAGPRAYHRMLRTERLSFPYAVVPRCQGEDETTATASHEILEATTNPDPDRPGFRLRSLAGSVAGSVAFAAWGAEPVDPCGLLNIDRHRAREAGFTVQRAWSNQSAERGGDPCLPSVPARPYVALVPRQPAVRLVRLGETVSIAVDAASDRPVPEWGVSAVEMTGGQEGQGYLDARLDRTEVGTGDVAILTLRVVRLHPGQVIVGLVSRLGTDAHLWPIAVNMR